MTKTTHASLSITYDWLLNTLKNSLTFAQEKVAYWRLRRPYAIERKEAEKQSSIGAAYDQSEYDSWCERIRINDQFEVWTELVRRLMLAVETNPYPGERKRVLQVAVGQVPDGGKLVWRVILEDPEFAFPRNFANERITFPELVPVSVEEIEAKLYRLVREDNTIVAAEVPLALELSPTGRQYARVRGLLRERGWSWKQRKEDGKVTKIVVPPG